MGSENTESAGTSAALTAPFQPYRTEGTRIPQETGQPRRRRESETVHRCPVAPKIGNPLVTSPAIGARTFLTRPHLLSPLGLHILDYS